ncbi:copper chaperone PCu(A)C [Spongiactinospora sp. TRM90649]|uniref:copper chaperone PCu(A)C n=1 Tax=Spongiactinospora sp. TRM90649 TaxID=3031114 RepID=UPI0023F71690|nr:copper chaperone PCu(A)C [Spongiactinospora sp. TRM90649]MDF5751709.1 copper chaperone PCu(A)C [Spongiactinospora sp. TRM90649]
MTRTSRRWAIAAAAFLAAAPALAGCATGFDATTATHYSPTEARATTVRGIQISQGFVLGPETGNTLPKGGSAPVYLTLANIGEDKEQLVGDDDQLTGATAEGVGTVKLTAPVSLPLGQRATTSGAGDQAGAATPQAASTGPQMVIEGLVNPLAGGEYVPITLQFANAGAVQVTLPVIPRTREFANWSPAPAPSGATSATPSTTPAPSGSPSAEAPTPTPSESAAH